MDPTVQPWRPETVEQRREVPNRWSAVRGNEAHRELLVGGVLLVVVAVVGLYLALRPGPTLIDQWVGDAIPANRSSAWSGVTSLRYPQWVVVGAVLLAAVAVPRDRLRALACLVGPPLALVSCELVVKPLVGRHLGAGLSYPSGSSVGAAALATAAVLAVPDRWRTPTVVIGTAYALWMSMAVIALQWHYPTDAMAGTAYGLGVVLLVDGATWWAATARPARHSPSRSGRG